MRGKSLTSLRVNTSSLISGVLALLLSGCSLNRVAVNVIGDALAGGGGVYASDDDPDLIREALPFGLKTFESLLEVSPDHRGLLLAASRGFASYAFLLESAASRHDSINSNGSRELRDRIRNLYLRGRDYALRGLETRHPGLANQLRSNPATALAATTKEDVPFLYWAGASLGGAMATSKNDLDLIAELPLCGALVYRALELDEHYDLGVAHEFFISFEASRPGGSIRRAREHYHRALEISGGQRASVHLALAEAVAVREQNLSEFRALLAAALAVDPKKNVQLRLANAIARQRAAWLQGHIDQLFLEAETQKENQR